MSVHPTHQRGVIKRAALQTKPAERKARRELTPHDYPHASRPTDLSSAPGASPRDESGKSAAQSAALASVFVHRGGFHPVRVILSIQARNKVKLKPCHTLRAF